MPLTVVGPTMTPEAVEAYSRRNDASLAPNSIARSLMLSRILRPALTLTSYTATPKQRALKQIDSLPLFKRTPYSIMSSEQKYELLYWPSIPGRGEFIRLALEATHTPYTDVGNASPEGINSILSLKSDSATHDPSGNPPSFAPPALRIHGEGKNGNPLVISQTPAILAFLGEKLDLAGGDQAERAWIQGLALTALDLNNETHDTHHPVSTMAYYEEQKEEALRKARDFREARIPKFFGYFERVLKGNGEGGGKYLVGDKLSYADLTFWQVVHGLRFAFPKELKAREEEFPTIFKTFFPSVPEHGGLKEYLESDRRKPYSNGIFRHYPELDRQ